MTRAIKFRAWDGNEKFMAPWDTVSWVFPKLLSQPHIHVMQFTGLTDRDGADIYEGDIVRYDTSNYVVVYRAPCFTTDWPNIGLNNSCTVIGNVHQNPELLTK